MSENRAFLALGSNIDPVNNLPAAVEKLSSYGTVLATSTVWESAPFDGSAQPNFWNAAVFFETSLSANELKFTAIDEIENALHRVRDPGDKNAARTIDIDIALFNREILRVGNSTIPDPALLERAFIAIPLAELDGDYVHPETHQTLSQIADQFDPHTCEMLPRLDVIL